MFWEHTLSKLGVLVERLSRGVVVSGMVVMVWVAGLSVGVGQDEQNPDEAYLAAYMDMMKGLELRDAGDSNGAISLLQGALRQLEWLGERWPDWNPDLRQYRVGKIREILETVPAAVRPVPVPPEVLRVAGGEGAVPPTSPPPAREFPRPELGGRAGLEMGGSLADQIRGVEERAQRAEELVRYYEEELQRQQEALASVTASRDGAFRDIGSATQAANRAMERAAELETALEEAEEEGAGVVAALKAELEEVRGAMAEEEARKAEADEEAKKLAAEVEALEETVAAMGREKEEYMRKANPEDMELQLKEIERLKNELALARAEIEAQREEIEAKDLRIGELTETVSKLRTEMVSLRRENDEYESAMAGMREELRGLQNQLQELERAASEEAEEAEGQMDETLLAEKKMLEEIILRQLRAQASQAQQKQMIIEHLREMEDVSADLLRDLETFEGARLSLSEDERALFTTPELDELLPAAGGLTGTTMLEGGGAAAEAAEQDPTAQGRRLAALLRSAEAAYEAGDMLASERIYEDYLRASPQDPAALTNLAVVKMRLGKPKDAEVFCRKALTYNRRYAFAHFILGVNHFNQSQDEEAMAALEESVRLDARNPKARHYLGVIASRMGLHDKAETQFKNAISLDPSYSSAYYNLAVLYATCDPPRFEEASRYYKEAIQNGAKRSQSMEQLLNHGLRESALEEGEPGVAS